MTRTGSNSSVWDCEATSYDELHSDDAVYLSCMRQSVASIPKLSPFVLDAGSGTGMSTSMLVGRGRLVVAVDYSIESLKRLKGKNFPNVMLIQADLTALPFVDQSFDVCVCANTLQHFVPGIPQQKAVSELERVCKKEGSLAVSVHHFSKAKRNAGWKKEGKPAQAGIDYIFRFTKEELCRLLPEARIRGVGYYGLARIPFIGTHIQDLVARLFGKLAGAVGIGHMLVAERRKPKNRNS